MLTVTRHASVTDRVAEVARRPEFMSFDTIANVQGDEPFLTKEALAGALDQITLGNDVGTAAAPLDPSLVDDPSRVKVVTDGLGRALYFSRAPIPSRRESGHPVSSIRASLGRSHRACGF